MKRLAAPLFLVVCLAQNLSAQPRLGPEIVVAGPFSRIVRPAFPEWKPPAFAAAGRNGHYLVAWAEHAEGKSSIATVKIDALGSVVPGTRRVAPPLRAFDPDAQFPAVAFDGERFLVAWTEGNGGAVLVGMRFDRDGKPFDPVPFMISMQSRATYVAATAANGEFVVTYGMSGFSAPVAAIARVGADGTVRERDVRLQGGSGFWRDIESNGSSLFVTSDSTAYQPPCVIGPFCFGSARRSFLAIPNGIHPTSAVPIVDVDDVPVPVGSGVATDGERYLVASWHQNLGAGQRGSFLRGQITDPAGTRFVREVVIAKDPEILRAQVQSARIDAVWTGGSYAVAHEVFGTVPNDNAIDLRLTFVGPTGMALNDPIDVATSEEQERTPVVLPIADTRVLVLYERGTPTNPSIVARTVGLAFKSRVVR